ncbi:DEAD/DEAH box helicase [Proteocatella sphenisci]|uniref:DEAD/DEAH box helicase n=1 Tax=Proteocatella sphenisci TaxID=181070 RepID=UPI0004B4A353|nr:DEAD/DEAH box helicase [Proteocatella sphenisci]
MKFKELNLEKQLLKALTEEGYEKPSPIQKQAIPPALEGRDILGCAQTGTGKTAAFALPILNKLIQNKDRKQKKIRALILTPTRELALQIYESIEAYGRHTGIKNCVIFGGVSAKPQIEKLRRGVDILVATPGRLKDLASQREVDLKSLEIFVLDEADRMLDMGFIHDVKKIITMIPEKRQTMFFSATMPSEIQNLVSKILKNPVKIEVAPVSSTADTIEQSVCFVDKNNKHRLLIEFLKSGNIGSSLVFTRTKHGADKLVKELIKAGINARAIHGNKSQNARQAALSEFKSGKIKVLVATDLAARGIDIEELSHVFNYDLPNIPETYVHRIGRTGRAGLEGISISFCNIEEKPYLKDIEKLIGKKIVVNDEHNYPMIVMSVPEKDKINTKNNTKSRNPRAEAPRSDRKRRPNKKK